MKGLLAGTTLGADDGIRTRDPHLGKVTEVMPPTRPDGYLPCSGPVHRPPLAAVAHRSQPPKVARKWHDARSSFRHRHSTGQQHRCNAGGRSSSNPGSPTRSTRRY